MHVLASLDSTESAKLFYWVCMGENFGWLGGWLVGWLGGPERFNQLPDGVASPNFQERYLVSRGWCPSFFFVERSKGQRSRGQKQGFWLKFMPAFSFWARSLIFSECVVLTMAEKLLDQIFDLGPQNFFTKLQKWSKFWTFSLFKLGPSNLGST